MYVWEPLTIHFFGNLDKMVQLQGARKAATQAYFSMYVEERLQRATPQMGHFSRFPYVRMCVCSLR